MLLMVMLPPVTSRLDSLPAAASCCRCASSQAMSGMLLDSTCVAPQHSTAHHVIKPAGRLQSTHSAHTPTHTHKLAGSVALSATAPHLLDVWHHQSVAGGHGNPYVVAVVLQQCTAPWLQAGVEPWVLAQADAEGLDHKGQVRQLGAWGGAQGGSVGVLVAIEFSTLAAIEFRSCRQGSSQESIVTPPPREYVWVGGAQKQAGRPPIEAGCVRSVNLLFGTAGRQLRAGKQDMNSHVHPAPPLSHLPVCRRV